MAAICIDKCSTDSYSTRTLLLICQLLYETVTAHSKDLKLSILLKKFKTHPLINAPEMKLTEKEFLLLTNNIILDTGVLDEQEPEEERLLMERKGLNYYKIDGKVEMVIRSCNIYFVKRTEELEKEISDTKKQFQETLADVKGN